MYKGLEELQELAIPLKKYLEANYDPHCKIVIGYNTVKVVREEMQAIFEPLHINDISKEIKIEFNMCFNATTEKVAMDEIIKTINEHLEKR